MNFFGKFLLFCLWGGLFSFAGEAADTLHVVTHNRVTVVTDPSQGFNLYKAWAKFPSAKEQIRQIKLKVIFGCPDSMRCADWDYKDHITIRRRGGVNGASADYEIGRMLTPYGGAFGKDWNFEWEVDVTDFSMLLRDSVEIEYNHTGWEPNTDRGWSVTLDFEIIKGKPAWEPLAIQKIYDGYFRYGDSTNSIENALKPVTFEANPEADFARLRVVQTGHGMDKPDGCAEFCNKYRELWYDGKLIAVKSVWKHCGDNPLYPQAGTWIYDRANWCPGNLMQPDSYDLDIRPGGKHTIDLNMQPYISSNPSADESISAYLIQYKKASAAHDVAIEAVPVPSLKDTYRRLNPAVMNPQVRVSNKGSEPVKRLQIRYGTTGFPAKEYHWTGLIPPSASADIVLPGKIEGKSGRHTFEVKLLQPNGRRDAWPADNTLKSTFDAAPVLDTTLVVYLLTNNEPEQTSWVICGENGKLIKERALGTLKANTVYRDTVRLPNGDYRFLLTDTGGDGLEFWANPQGGRGKARLLNMQGLMVKDIESDFGSSFQYDFAVGQPLTPLPDEISFGLYPTRTNAETTLDYYANFPADVTVQIITDPGDNLVEEHHYPRLQKGMFTYNLDRFPKSRYYLKVLVNGEEKFKKRIRLKER